MTTIDTNSLVLVDAQGNDIFDVDTYTTVQNGHVRHYVNFYDATATTAWCDTFHKSFCTSEKRDAYLNEFIAKRGLAVAEN